MNFKDSLFNDLPTFINTEEFAETINYNGDEIPAVVTQNSASSKSLYTVKKQISPARHLNLRGDFLVIYVKSHCLKKLPKSGEFVKVNDIRYKVASVTDLQGVCKIVAGTDLDGGAVTMPPRP